MSAEHRIKPPGLPLHFPLNIDDPIDRRTAMRLSYGALGTIAGFATVNGGMSIHRLTNENQAEQAIEQKLENYSVRTGEAPTTEGYQTLQENLTEIKDAERDNAEINAAVSIPIAALAGGAIVYLRTRGRRLDRQNR